MQLNLCPCCLAWSFINAGHFDPAVIARMHLDPVAWILRLGGRHDAARIVGHHTLTPRDLLPSVVAPKHTCDHAAARHRDVFCAAPCRKAVMLPSDHRKCFLPPTVQALTFISDDDECTLP